MVPVGARCGTTASSAVAVCCDFTDRKTSSRVPVSSAGVTAGTRTRKAGVFVPGASIVSP